VLARPDQPTYPLPIEKTCAATIDRHWFDPEKVNRNRIAEVSRLAVIREFRRRKGEERSKDAAAQIDFGTEAQPRFPHIQLGLYLGAIALGVRLGIETLVLLTEPRLADHFKKLGFPVRQFGGPVEHRGTRVPSMANLGETVAGLRFFLRPLYRVVAEEIRTGLDDTRPT
jgi:N-acyl amino acid synthase of PEP-CTERM/exosortase system